MIYICYILALISAIMAGEHLKWSPETTANYENWFLICIAIIPIWYGIRQCVRELEKIRKQLEQRSEGDAK